MLKRILAAAMALIIMIMPMTAGAVSWSQIVEGLWGSNTYTDGQTTATRNGDTTTVTGGAVDSIYIAEDGHYVLNGVTVEGESLVINAYDGAKITLTMDKDTTFKTDEYGLDIYASNNSEVTVHNDTQIVGTVDSLFIGTDSSSKVTVDGSGTVHYSTNYSGQYAEGYNPVEIYVNDAKSREEALTAIRETVKIDQNYKTAEGMNIASIGAWVYDNGVEKDYYFYVDANGDLYESNEDGSSTLIEKDFFNEPPQVEPEPVDWVEELRQAQGIGGVTTSPVWNWQGYLGHSSKPMWIYVNGEKVLMLQRLFWLPDGTKNHTCRINIDDLEPASVELRIGLDMLRTAKRAEISVISILEKEGGLVAQFGVDDMLAAFDEYGLVEGELLCISGDADAEVMKVTLEGEYVALED